MKTKIGILEEQRFASIFFLLAIVFYCFCGSEFKVQKRFPQCRPDNTYQIIQWQCRGCSYTFTSDDYLKKELDYEGLS